MVSLKPRAGAPGNPCNLWSGAAVMSFLAVVWSVAKLFRALNPIEPGLSETYQPPLRIPSQTLAMTDRGRTITVYECAEPNPKSKVEAARHLSRRISIAPSDPRANCHGWVFTGGKYFVDGKDVDAILKDNWYEPILAPEVDDLVVWRDSTGLPVHTGVVKATGLDGFVLVESKWGHMGRYLHKPGDAEYSKDLAYYRSSRLGHLLHMKAEVTSADD